MPKGKGKGGKNKRRGKKNRGGQDKRELIFKEDGQEYALVIKMLGDGRLEAECGDGRRRLCHIRGKFRKRVWIRAEDILLLGLRDFEDNKADVIHKYSQEEGRTLQAYGELPTSWLAEAKDEEDAGVIFGAQDSSSSDGGNDGVAATVEELLDAL